MNRRSVRFLWQLVVLALFLGGCGPSERLIEVSIAVNFGPAARPGVEKKVTLDETSTVFEALRQAFPVVTSGR